MIGNLTYQQIEELLEKLSLSNNNLRTSLEQYNTDSELTAKANKLLQFSNELEKYINNLKDMVNLNKDVDIEVIDLDDSNSTLLNDSTKEEIDTLMNNVSTNAFSVLLLQKANILFPSFSSMLNSFTVTENALNSDEEELTPEFVKSEVNNALTEVLDEYVTDSMFNASVDPNEYINGEKIKGYCTRATQIILTDSGIQYVGDNGITYEGTVTTDIDTGYLMVTEMIEK